VEEGQSAVVGIERTGDVSDEISYFVSTAEIPYSASGGDDFVVKATSVTFAPGQREGTFVVETINDGQKESLDEDVRVVVRLASGEKEIASTVVRIAGEKTLVFPGNPAVFHAGGPGARAGESALCIDACDPEHPEFEDKGAFCAANGIKNTTKRTYEWVLDEEPLRATSVLAGTGVFEKELSSAFVLGGRALSCRVRPASGVWAKSASAVVDSESRCDAPGFSGLRSRNFDANLNTDGGKLNLVVRVPHVAGMLPIVSTREINDITAVMGMTSRRQMHACSNLVDGASGVRWIQRGADDDAHCLNVFEASWAMEDFLGECGGTLIEEGFQVGLDTERLSVRTPLFVVYAYFSPEVDGGWSVVNHRTELEYSFVYKTNVLGGGIIAQGGIHEGSLAAQRVGLTQDNRLELIVQSEARFRGGFVAADSVVASNGGEFTIEEIGAINSYDNGIQTFRITSAIAMASYDGDYEITLNACSVGPTTAWKADVELTEVCEKRDDVVFELPVEFAAAAPKVATAHTLNTEFLLHTSGELFAGTSDDPAWWDSVQMASQGAIAADDTIYGHLLYNPLDNVRGLSLEVSSVMLCSGVDGYTPQYNPENGNYGCMQPDARLSKRIDVSTADDFIYQSSGPRFSISASPLFEEMGYEWFVHVEFSSTASRGRRAGEGGGVNLVPLKLARKEDDETKILRTTLTLDRAADTKQLRLDIAEALDVGANMVTVVETQRRSAASYIVDVHVRRQNMLQSQLILMDLEFEDYEVIDISAAVIVTDDTTTSGTTTMLSESSGSGNGGNGGEDDDGSSSTIIIVVVVVVVVIGAAAVVLRKMNTSKEKKKIQEEEIDLDCETFSVHGGTQIDGFESEI
jgi:hypothetical protein